MLNADRRAGDCPRLLVVSNRLPVTAARTRGGGITYKASAGGLATALAGVSGLDFLWVGWPGTDVPPEQQPRVEADLRREHQCLPIFLSAAEIDQFYNRFSNGVLWPLFHYLPEFNEFHREAWESYREVNRQFAQRVAPLVGPNTTVWIHDYQLMLLPKLLRELVPEVRIGFFLHIPFPASEVYRLLPVREEILEGLLGADVVGFHTHDYAQHFRSAAMRILGCDSTPQYATWHGRQVRLAVSPIGIDLDHFHRLARDPGTVAQRDRLRQQHGGRRLVLGVDRLDYSKGLSHKLRAFHRFLDRYPQWRDKVVLLQVAVPSRTEVKQYRRLRREIEELVGHINGLHSTVDTVPVQFLFKGVPPQTLSALYQLADVCWVTSIRDGMNLVAQEYVASRQQDDAALVLSEFTGAAHGLDGAVLVNPWNEDQMAEALRQALELTPEERAARGKRLRMSVSGNSSTTWARDFVNLIDRHCATVRSAARRRPLAEQLERLLQDYRQARRRFLLLDYDGTLTGYAPTPDEATPGPQTRALVQQLAEDSRNEVYVVSGRPCRTLEEWLGDLPIGLCAEHGWLVRPKGQQRWKRLVRVSLDWMQEVLPILEDFAARTPGAMVERKAAALAWHWRRCDPEFGQWKAHELGLHLSIELSNLPVEVIRGNKVIEVRAQGLNKGALVRWLESRFTPADFILGIGDDRTDEDLFAALPAGAWSVRIGDQPTQALYFVQRREEVSDLLRALAGGVPTPDAPVGLP